MKVRGRTNRGNPYTLSNYFGKLKESLEMSHITAENNKEDFLIGSVSFLEPCN